MLFHRPMSRTLQPEAIDPSHPLTRQVQRTVPRHMSVEDLASERGFLPLLGLAGAVIGTIWAMATIPANASKAGALMLPALGMALSLVAAPAFAALLSLRNALRTENLLALAPIYWILMDLIRGLYDMPGVSEDDVRIAFAGIGIYSATMWLGTMGRPWKLPKSLVNVGGWVPKSGIIMSIATAMFVLAMLRFALPCKFDIPLMISGLSMDRWAAPWSGTREGNIGGWGAFIEHLVYFGYLLPTMAVILVRRHGWGNIIVWLALLMSAVFLIFMAQGGGRRIIGVCVGSAMLYYVMDLKRIRWLHLALMGIGLMILLWVLSFMLVARSQGIDDLGKLSQYTTYLVQGKLGDDKHGMTVDDNFYRMAQLASFMPKLQPYLKFGYIWYVAVRPIPRALWKNKPIDGGFYLHYWVGEGASLSTSVIGEYYMSYGLLAVALGGLFTGKLAGLSAPFFNSRKGGFGLLLYGYMTMWLVGGFRSLQDLMVFSYPMLALILFSRFFKKPGETAARATA